MMPGLTLMPRHMIVPINHNTWSLSAIQFQGTGIYRVADMNAIASLDFSGHLDAIEKSGEPPSVFGEPRKKLSKLPLLQLGTLSVMVPLADEASSIRFFMLWGGLIVICLTLLVGVVIQLFRAARHSSQFEEPADSSLTMRPRFRAFLELSDAELSAIVAAYQSLPYKTELLLDRPGEDISDEDLMGMLKDLNGRVTGYNLPSVQAILTRLHPQIADWLSMTKIPPSGLRHLRGELEGWQRQQNLDDWELRWLVASYLWQNNPAANLQQITALLNNPWIHVVNFYPSGLRLSEVMDRVKGNLNPSLSMENLQKYFSVNDPKLKHIALYDGAAKSLRMKMKTKPAGKSHSRKASPIGAMPMFMPFMFM
jgi:hypothetical protein